MSERRWSVETLAGAHPRVALDSNVLIYVLDGSGPLAETAQAVLDAAAEGRFVGAMSVVAVTEALVGFARTGDARRFEHAAEELRESGITVIPVDLGIAEDAAWLRGAGDLSPADALHLASARAFGASAFITNDRRIRSIPKLDVLYLDDPA